MKQKIHQVIISLASNEQQEQHLEAAREQLTLILADLHFTSRHWTEPLHSSRQALYLNQLCEGTTTFSANLLEEVLKEIEKRLGRTRNEDGIVTLDLDLMLYDGERHHLRDWERNYIKDLLGELHSLPGNLNL
ncbi:MAG: 2-amino-4-hydroxy-6-hydroxymethyldihydropteridine diphosphokinase [Prevotella sp.]|nr:2-amino-4-hydroxy-6-hydroxymethyldihydropteridine diphosphokinase [Prevotella sp.]